MRYAIFGAGGFGREIAPLLPSPSLPDAGRGAGDHVVFAVDAPELGVEQVNGRPLISFEKLCGPEHLDRAVLVALGDSRLRRQVVERCRAAGLTFGRLQAVTHVRYDDVVVGDGAVFCDFTMVTSNARIGEHFQCNIYSYVAHDCVIGDFVTFAPQVGCNGNVHIEDDVYVGTGAVIKPGVRIGRGAVIGMGAVVTKDVPAYTTVVGNPARPVTRP